MRVRVWASRSAEIWASTESATPDMVSVRVTVEVDVKKEASLLPSTSKRWPRGVEGLEVGEPLDVVVVGFEKEDEEEEEDEERASDVLGFLLADEGEFGCSME